MNKVNIDSKVKHGYIRHTLNEIVLTEKLDLFLKFSKFISTDRIL